MPTHESSARTDRLAVKTLEGVVDAFAFDNFLHVAQLANLSAEADISPRHWRELIEAWRYDPEVFLAEHGRGNCADFAHKTQEALGAAGVRSAIIGKLPDDRSPEQQRSLKLFPHVSVLSGETGNRMLYDPVRKEPLPIPLEPIGRESRTGRWEYKTLELNDTHLVQQQAVPANDYVGQRIFELTPLDADKTTRMIRGIFRVAQRKLEMITRRGDETSHVFICYDPRQDALRSNIKGLPSWFEPEEIPSKTNESISEAFGGFDVQAELVAALGIYRKFPEDFWLK